MLNKVIVGLFAISLIYTSSAQLLESSTNSLALAPEAPLTNRVAALTIEGPLISMLADITTATNLSIAPYGIYDTGSKSYGGGLLAVYNISQWAAGAVGMQYLNKELWMPSAQLQLQAPVLINKSLSLIPFVFTGIGTPISGGGKDFADNGSPVGIFGAGVAVKILGDMKSSHLDVFAAIAKWSNFSGEQIYGGVVWRF